MANLKYSAGQLRRRLRVALLALLPTLAAAQAPQPDGDGIVGEYYEGPDFDRLVTRRRDATLAFDWGHRPPVPGLSAEYFSVRWTGWLVPPVSGRYVLHATADDGIRIWLNDRLVMNEWRPQPVSTFTTSVELKAGEPYRLRVDYFQDILDTRLRITWERPDLAPVAAPTSTWRNLWGLTDEPLPAKAVPIPTRFLFSRNPRPAVALTNVSVTATPVPKDAAAPAKAAAPAPGATRTRQAAASPVRRRADLVPTAAKPAVLARPSATVATTVDSTGAARLRHLAVGETVTLPALYFEQGQAQLLPSSRVALDELAAVLKAQPALRLEVQGHTDNVGNAELNRQLSQQRAETVYLYLTAHGVATAQLRPVGYGGTQPVADNADPAQRPRNRRVVLRRL